MSSQQRKRVSSRKVSHMAPRSSEDSIAPAAPAKSSLSPGARQELGRRILPGLQVLVSVLQLASHTQPWRAKGIAVAMGSVGFTRAPSELVQKQDGPLMSSLPPSGLFLGSGSWGADRLADFCIWCSRASTADPPVTSRAHCPSSACHPPFVLPALSSVLALFL